MEKPEAVQVQTPEAIHQQTANQISNELSALGDVLGNKPAVMPVTAETNLEEGSTIRETAERLWTGVGVEPSGSFRQKLVDRLKKMHPGAAIKPVNASN